MLVALVVAAALLADWRLIGKSFFDPQLIRYTLLHGFVDALWHTAAYTAGGFLLGLLAGTLLALMRLSEVAPYRWLATIYIEFFRGLPALVVFMAFSLLPLAFSGLTLPWYPYGPAWAALGIVGSAYMAETIRAGIQAVPRGQVEAARSLGMSAGQAMRKITLPQAFRIMVPPLTNELIMLIKDSSLVFVVGLSASGFELTMFGRSMANSNVNITPLVVAGLGYLAITLPLSILVRRMEARA
ncbi:MAG TPA: amino acid ABC transporter permease [Salinisphaeraceae bacterium]|nr:amino acid ABC transporter permease [Salinisphaeraceae bacterium]